MNLYSICAAGKATHRLYRAMLKADADPVLGHELEIQCVMPASTIAVFMSSVISSSSASAT